MAITKGAKKAIRQSQRKKVRNVKKMKKLKNLLKKVRGLVSQQKINEAKKLLPEVYKSLDKAGKAGLVKKKTAWRKKSRITKSLNVSKK